MPKATPKRDPSHVAINPVRKGDVVNIAICGMERPVQKLADEDGLYFALAGGGFYASARTIWEELDKLMDT